MRSLRLLWVIIKRSGALEALMGFLALYLACSLVVLLAEPGISRFGDALWFLWAVSTTVGLGDFTAITLVGRLAAIVCSISAILTTAIITGVVVDYFNERRQQQLDGSMADLLDKLENLPSLSEGELAEVSARVRRYRASVAGQKRDAGVASREGA